MCPEIFANGYQGVNGHTVRLAKCPRTIPSSLATTKGFDGMTGLGTIGGDFLAAMSKF